MSIAESSKEYLFSSEKMLWHPEEFSDSTEMPYAHLQHCPLLKLTRKGKLTWNKGFVCLIPVFSVSKLASDMPHLLFLWSTY